MTTPFNYQKGILIDSVDRQTLRFQYNPELIQENREPDWASHKGLGRSHPIYQFVSGGGRILTFNLRMHWETPQGDEILSTMKFLRSLTYPDHSKGVNSSTRSAPHPCILMLGDYYKNSTWLVKSLSDVTNSKRHVVTGKPLVAEIKMTFLELVERSIDYLSVRSDSGSIAEGAPVRRI